SLFYFSVIPPPPRSTLFPYTTLFRSEGGLYLMGRYILPVQATTTTFLFTIMLGVGTDYSIFLMARYREERVEGNNKAQAVQTSVDRKSTRLNSSHLVISYAVFCLKKK